MQWFYNLKVAAKLILGFVIVALIAGVVGVIGLINLNGISEADRQLYEENTLGLNYAGNAAVYYQRIRFNVVKMIAVDDAAERDTCISNINDYSIKGEELLQLYEKGIISEADRNEFNALKPQWDKYKALTDDTVKLIQSGQEEQAENIIFGEAATVGNSLQESFDKIFEYNAVSGKSRSDHNAQLAETATLIMIIVIIAGVIIAVALGIFISRIISKPVGKMVDAADRLAVGDVNVNVRADTRDEIGRLAEAFGRMIENIREQAMAAERMAAGDLTIQVNVRSEDDLLGKKLSEMVEKNNEVLTNIASASEQVAAGAKQVSDSSTELSQGATEQASSIEELTASLEEMSSQTKLNAQNANQANELAETAKTNAEQGNKQMADMLKAMEEINDSSANISKIIKVIDEIAFQTNILALNAAVEAARAGQHGKGFAVVAEEVRNLAARSANAAKETTDLIEGSIKKAENGTKIASETANALNKIVEDVAKAASLVGDIAIASNEQATGIAQINQGIMQVSQVVQANSATSEESAAASEELSSQAELLKESVSKFKLKKVSQSYGQYEELSPEVLKLLEDMSEKKKLNKSHKEETQNETAESKSNKERKKEDQGEAAVSKHKIALSDKEFGKY